MTDLDSTEILAADESFTENSSTNDTKASLTIVSGTDSNTFEINKETVIGRSSPSDIIIAGPSLSKQHAKVTINNGQYFLTDLGSSNKTFQNKVQLQPNVCYALHDGDEIKFGDIICSYKEEKQRDIATETKINSNPSTHMITNSYDDQEPSQPMKVWNKDSNDITPKTNGVNESPNKSSSSFIPQSAAIPTNDDDDDNVIIGSATVPVVEEPKEVNDDNQLEIVPNQNVTSPENEPMTTENPKLNEENENITDNPVISEVTKETSSEEQMDTDQATESPAMVIDEKESENANEMEDEVAPISDTNDMPVEEAKIEVPPITMEAEASVPNVDESLTKSEEQVDEPIVTDVPEEEPSSTGDMEEEPEESAAVSTRGVARRNVRRARGRRGAAVRARVVSTRIHGGRRQAVVRPKVASEENNETLEETINTETEESPKKSTLPSKTKEEKPTIPPNQESSQPNTGSNVRISARIKERASSGRNRQFPYTDDYVDLDDIEKQSKANATTTTTTTARKSNRGRPSASPQKRVSLRQEPIDASASSEQKDNTNIYEQIDTAIENKEPTPKTAGRKRKTEISVSPVTTKRNRPTTPQTVPTINTRRKQTSTTIEKSPTVTKPGRRSTSGQQQQPATTAAVTTATTVTTPKRGRKSTKLATSTEQSPEKQSSTTDRPVRIALSSHLNFDQNHIDTLRKLGFEIMDESCQVDALVVDRIRRTKKFFMCLARGAHILSPGWIDAMVKEHRYIPYDKYYLEDTTAETRYGFKLRESVRLAKQGPIFQNQKFFCTQDTSPPYDDLKDIIEAAGGKLVDKINMTKPGKDIICIVAQAHKNEYEDLFKKGVTIVSEEFILSGISKQKLDFDAFSLFQNSSTIKPNNGK